MQSYTSDDYPHFLLKALLRTSNQAKMDYLIQESIDRGLITFDDISEYINSFDPDDNSDIVVEGLARAVLLVFDNLSDDTIQDFFQKVDFEIWQLMKEGRKTCENLLKKLLERFDISLINQRLIFYCGEIETAIDSSDAIGMQYDSLKAAIYSGNHDKSAIFDNMVSDKIKECAESGQYVTNLFRYFTNRNSQSYRTLVECVASMINEFDTFRDFLSSLGRMSYDEHKRYKEENSIVLNLSAIFQDVCEINGGKLLNGDQFTDEESMEIILLVNVFCHTWDFSRNRHAEYKNARAYLRKTFHELTPIICPCLSDACQQYISTDMTRFLTDDNIQYDSANLTYEFYNIDHILRQLNDVPEQSDDS